MPASGTTPSRTSMKGTSAGMTGAATVPATTCAARRALASTSWFPFSRRAGTIGRGASGTGLRRGGDAAVRAGQDGARRQPSLRGLRVDRGAELSWRAYLRPGRAGRRAQARGNTSRAWTSHSDSGVRTASSKSWRGNGSTRRIIRTTTISGSATTGPTAWKSMAHRLEPQVARLCWTVCRRKRCSSTPSTS